MSLPDDCDSEIDQLILCRKFYTVYHITKYKSSTFLLSCYPFLLSFPAILFVLLFTAQPLIVT